MRFRTILPVVFWLTFFSLCASFVGAQGTIRGFVYDEKTQEPIIFTNVYLKGTTYGAVTDKNGFYSIAKVPQGVYTLTVSFLGFDTLYQEVTVNDGQLLTRKLFLKKSSVKLREVSISAAKQEAQTEVKVSVQKITPNDIKQLPSVGGEADIAQYLTVMPGVILTGDQGGQLYIRGGSPIQNKVLLDGMVIYNPFHSIGLFSVFDTDIIRNADIYTGGFNAEYGGRISSVMDITTRDGNKNQIGGKVGASSFGGKLLLEGPISRAKELGGSSSSYIISAKHSYLEESSKLLYEYIDEDGLPFSFTDLYGKVSFNGANGSKFNLFGFSFNDQVKYQAVSDLNWQAYGVGSNFVLVPQGSAVLVEGNFAYSTYDIELIEENVPPRSSAIEGFNLGLDFTYFLSNDEIKYGIEVIGFGTDFEFFNESGRRVEQDQNTTELAGYFKYRWNIGKFVIDPSLRMHYYASLSTLSPEPRLGVKVNLDQNTRIKMAAGLYSQNLISANSDRDVVNLFYGFLSGPDNLQDDFVQENGDVREISHKLQKAQHYILGVERDLGPHLNINVEGYLKRFTQLTNINRNKLFEDTAENNDQPDELKKDFIVEEGDAYGVDFVLKYNLKRFSLWAVYSLGYVERWDGIQTYNPVFDRRHNVNLLGTYRFGKNRNFELSVRWNLGSGFPFTQTQGFYEGFNFSDGINTDYTSTNGQLEINYADINKGRLPYYHRLDVSLKKTWAISVSSKLEANLGITNAYDRQNIFYVNRISGERVDQLPFMPSGGLYLTF